MCVCVRERECTCLDYVVQHRQQIQSHIKDIDGVLVKLVPVSLPADIFLIDDSGLCCCVCSFDQAPRAHSSTVAFYSRVPGFGESARQFIPCLRCFLF